MKRVAPITTLFLDIGGVLLTNGWDHHVRRRAAKHFNLEWAAEGGTKGQRWRTGGQGRARQQAAKKATAAKNAPKLASVVSHK